MHRHDTDTQSLQLPLIAGQSGGGDPAPRHPRNGGSRARLGPSGPAPAASAPRPAGPRTGRRRDP
ncbi:unnamed protein product, partial [Bubo scandiacus]